MDHRGQIDRKCLRKSCGSWLAANGADLRVTQRIMRHKDPKMTTNIYTDPFMLDMKSAVERVTYRSPKVCESGNIVQPDATQDKVG